MSASVNAGDEVDLKGIELELSARPENIDGITMHLIGDLNVRA